MKSLTPYALLSAFIFALLGSVVVTNELYAPPAGRRQKSSKPKGARRGGARRGGARRGGRKIVSSGGVPAAVAGGAAAVVAASETPDLTSKEMVVSPKTPVMVNKPPVDVVIPPSIQNKSVAEAFVIVKLLGDSSQLTPEQARGLLGLQVSSSRRDIEARIRQLGAFFHPDKYSNNTLKHAQAKAVFQKIQEAKEVLLDPTNKEEILGIEYNLSDLEMVKKKLEKIQDKATSLDEANVLLQEIQAILNSTGRRSFDEENQIMNVEKIAKEIIRIRKDQKDKDQKAAMEEIEIDLNR